MKKWNQTARKLMREKRLKQKDLALALDVSEQAVSAWMQGTRTPRLPVLIRIAGLLGVSMSELVEGDMRFVMDRKEMELLDKFRDLPPAQQELLLRMIKSLSPPDEE